MSKEKEWIRIYNGVLYTIYYEIHDEEVRLKAFISKGKKGSGNGRKILNEFLTHVKIQYRNCKRIVGKIYYNPKYYETVLPDLKGLNRLKDFYEDCGFNPGKYTPGLDYIEIKKKI